MKMKLLWIAIVLFTAVANAQTLNKIEVKPNTIASVSGDLSKGVKLESLRWAESSSMACFPGTQNQKFNGNHVFYRFEIPAYSEVTIKVIPTDVNANMSIYGYQVGTSNLTLPPDISSCVSCEADHKWDYKKRGQTQDHTRSISFNSIKNPYGITFAVVGAEGLTNGGFKVEINLKSRVESTEKQEAVKVFSAKSEKGKVLAYTGNLNQGTKVHDLSFAERSNVACFPATQNKKFRGNHVFFTTTLPSNSKMKITLIPKDKSKNMSLYGYQDGVSSTSYPPNVTSCVSCEADHKWDYPKRGKTQDHTRSIEFTSIRNSYRIVIGVAGAEGLTEGDFDIQISVE